MKKEKALSRKVDWRRILKKLIAAAENKDKSFPENILFYQIQLLPQVNENNVIFDCDDDKTMTRLTGVSSRQPLDSLKVNGVVATDGRSFISLTSSEQNITIVPKEPVDSLAQIQGIERECPETRVVFELFFHADIPALKADSSLVITKLVGTANGTPFPLTSGGMPLTFSTDTQDGGKITFSAGVVPVFIFTITGDGSYTFEQLWPLDHPDDADPNDPITLLVNMVIKDGDLEAAWVSFIVLIDGYSRSIFFDTSSYSNGDNIDGNIYTILDLIVEQTGTAENATVNESISSPVTPDGYLRRKRNGITRICGKRIPGSQTGCTEGKSGNRCRLDRQNPSTVESVYGQIRINA